MTRVVYIQRVMIKRCQRSGDTAHNGHRVRVAAETVEQTRDLLVDHGMASDCGFELVVLFLRRFFAVQQDITHFQIVGLGRQLVNREAAMQQNTFVTVDESNFGFAGCGRGETWVKSKHPF